MPSVSPIDPGVLPAEVIDAYLDGRLVVVMGPEASVAAGLHSRHALAQALLTTARDRGRPEDTCDAIEVRLAHDVPGALSALRRELDEPTVRAHVERAFDDRGLTPSALHHAIAGLTEAVDRLLTLNLDRLLDRALPSQWARLPELTTQTRGQRHALFKLHGTLSLVDTWRLTAGRLAELGASEAVRGFLGGLFHEQLLLLVGFDPGEGELDALLDLAGAPKDATDLAMAHVALVPEGIDAPRRAALANRGVRLVPVGAADDHAYIDGTAELLRTLRPGTEAPSPSLTSAGAQLQEVSPDASPFPGLLPFSEHLGEFFHGRTDEVQVALSMLGGPPGPEHTRWLQVEGPSGVGKSSFVQAGLLPVLRGRGVSGGPARYRVALLRPGQLPLRALAWAVSGQWASPEHAEGEAETLEAELETRDDALATYVGRHLEEDEALVLVVDQLEEAVTFAAGSHRGPFAAALATALRHSTGRLYLVTTLRSDYVGHLANDLPRLATLLNAQVARYTVGPLSTADLRAAIEQPAIDCGTRLQDGLVKRIIQDAHDLPRGDDDRHRGPDATLPLVAHVMKALWGTREEHEGRLTLSAYHALGGVSGALTKSADALLDGLDENRMERVQAMLLELVSVQEQGRDTKRSATRQDVVAASGDDGEALLQRLSGGIVQPSTTGKTTPPLQARVLVVTGEGEQARVDLVHEALLYQWATLRRWLDERREHLLRREELRRATREFEKADWVPHGARRDYLLSIPPTTEAEREFHRRMRRVSRRQGLVWVSLGVVLAVAALGSGTAAWVARVRRIEAETAQEAEQAQRTLAESRLRKAARLAEKVVFTITRKLRSAGCAVEVQKELLESAYELQDALGERAPDDVTVLRGQLVTHGERGIVAMSHDNLTLARREYEAAVVIAEQLIQKYPFDVLYRDDLSLTLQRLGDVEVAAGKLKRARAHFSQSMDIFRRLAEADPKNAQLQHDLSISYGKLGEVEMKAGNLEQARVRFSQSMDVFQRLADADPKNAKLHRDLSVLHNKLGEVEMKAGNLEQARARFSQSLNILWQLADVDPTNALLQRSLAVSLQRMGDVEIATDNLEEARIRFSQSLNILRRLAGVDPKNALLQRSLAVLYNKQGTVEMEADNLEKARARFARSLDIAQRLAEADPQNTIFQRDIYISKLKLGEVEMAAGNLGHARSRFAQGLDIVRRLAKVDPHNAQLRFDMAETLMRLVQFAASEAEVSRHLGEADRILDAMDAAGQLDGFQEREDMRATVNAKMSELGLE